MLYNLLSPLSTDVSFLNVFRYITFRSAGALVTALILSIALGPLFIEWLRRLKWGQYILEDVPVHKNKAGTPTMGGLLILFSATVSVMIWADLMNPYVWLSILVLLSFGAVGFWDDFTKLRGKHNKGIRARTKFSALTLVAVGVMILLLQLPAYSTVLSIPMLKDVTPDLGWFYIPFAVIVMVGASNAVNLTDGLDGLAIAPVAVGSLVLGIFMYLTGTAAFASHLYLPHIPGVGEVTVFCAAIVGACIGFLWFNAYPAQVFMGDVGSLALGGTLGFMAVLCKQELLLVVIGGLFVVETLSVVLQVGYFRFTKGKRILRMAPLHHHFELKGIPESKIIIRFWIVSVLLGMLALSMLKLR